MALISVIIPVYNVCGFLDRCLETIIDQSYTDLEILLVDDGSTDGSGELCDEWAARDERIRVIHKPNGGAADARNVGIEAATGEYLMFVDADDYAKLDLCEKLYAAIQDYNVACAVIGFSMVDEHNKQGDTVCVSQLLLKSGIEMIRERYLRNNPAAHIVEPWGKLFHRSMWQNVRFTKGMYYEDMEVMPRLYYRCPKIAVIPGVGYYYFQRGDSASHSGGTDHKRVTDSVLIRRNHMRFYEEIGEKELAVEIAERLLDLIITSDCNGWIPKEEAENCKEAFCEGRRLIRRCGRADIKARIRYGIYSVFGAKGYSCFFR